MMINYPIYKDGILSDYLSGFHLGKAKIYNLFVNKNILLNNHVARQTDSIKNGDIVSIFYDEEIDYKVGSGVIDVLYEDDYFLIINKNRGIIIHDGKDNDGALCNDVAKYFYDNGIYLSVKFPNRIDRDTSGIMIFCKDMLTEAYMSYLMENHDIVKEYLAICGGKLKNKSGSISYRIGRDRHIDKMRVSSTGAEALTLYEVLKEEKEYSLVKCRIKTGRTHQIRVHMSYIGNPIVGDSLYGGSTKYSNRTLLHSYRVEFIHPVSLEKIEVLAPIPSDMKGLV